MSRFNFAGGIGYSSDMFERYTEKARRTIFFARYEASQFGSRYIETEHLLLGLLREDKELASRLLGSHAGVESIRKQIEGHTAQGEKLPTSVDMPLSHECIRALAYGAEESARLKHQHVGTGHLLLGLFRDEKCFAAQLLRERGLTLDSVRDEVRKPDLDEHAEPGYAVRLEQWLAEIEARGSGTVKHRGIENRTHIAIYEGPLTGETPTEAPLLCIEMIRDERFSEIQRRCDDHLAEGVTQVWLLDPVAKRAYTATKIEGLREFKGGILRVADPPIELDLNQIFA